MEMFRASLNNPIPHIMFFCEPDEHELEVIETLEKTYSEVVSDYRKKAWHFKVETDESKKPYMESISDITEKALADNDPILAVCGNYFLNELQCDFVISNHEQKFSKAFKTAHEKINAFMENLEDNEGNKVLKELIEKSNYRREHYFDVDPAVIAEKAAKAFAKLKS